MPWALLLPLAASGAAWSWAAVGACVALRTSAALMVGGRVLGDNLRWWRFWLLPLQDGLSLLVWFAGLFGRRIVWRGRAYELSRDGRLRPWKA